MKKTFFIMILITSITLNSQDNVTVTITPDNTNVTGHFGKEEEINTNKTRTLKVILEGVETKGKINANASDNLTIKQTIDAPLFLESIQKPNKAGEFHMTLSGTLDSEIKSSGKGSGGAALAGFSGTGKGAIKCNNGYKSDLEPIDDSRGICTDPSIGRLFSFDVSVTDSRLTDLKEILDKNAPIINGYPTYGVHEYKHALLKATTYGKKISTCSQCGENKETKAFAQLTYTFYKPVIKLPKWNQVFECGTKTKSIWASAIGIIKRHELKHHDIFLDSYIAKIESIEIFEKCCSNADKTKFQAIDDNSNLKKITEEKRKRIVENLTILKKVLKNKNDELDGDHKEYFYFPKISNNHLLSE